MTEQPDMVERLNAAPLIEHARIVAPADRVPEVVIPVTLRDEAAQRIATLEAAASNLVKRFDQRAHFAIVNIENGAGSTLKEGFNQEIEALRAALSPTTETEQCGS